MALLVWSSQYSVGVEEMDRQHKVLFDLLNQLHEAMLQGKAQSITGELLRKLVDYTRRHFAAEEGMQAAAGFPGLALHRIKHRELIKQVEQFVVRYERGESAMNVQLMGFLREWLTKHIQQTDREYGPSVNKYLKAKAGVVA